MYQIWFKYLAQSLRTIHVCSRRSTDDVVQINFCLHVRSYRHLRMFVLHLHTKFCANSSSSTEILAFYEIQYGHRLSSWICWRKSGTIQEGQCIPCKNVMASLVVFKPFQLLLFTWAQNFSFWRQDSQNLGKHRPQRHIIAGNGMTCFETSLVETGGTV